MTWRTRRTPDFGGLVERRGEQLRLVEVAPVQSHYRRHVAHHRWVRCRFLTDEINCKLLAQVVGARAACKRLGELQPAMRCKRHFRHKAK